eukprot:Hpha_TRINITY_DN12763_c0_g1::TRINITY_DN12763_c0_g1_i1::g.114537::m.114537
MKMEKTGEGGGLTCRRPARSLQLGEEGEEPDGMYAPDDAASHSDSENGSFRKTTSCLKSASCTLPSRRSCSFATEEAVVVPITPPAHPARAGQFSQYSAVAQGRPTLPTNVLQQMKGSRRRAGRPLPKPPARGSGASAPHYGAWAPRPRPPPSGFGVVGALVIGVLMFAFGGAHAYTSPHPSLSVIVLGLGWWLVVSSASCWSLPKAQDEVPRRQGLFCVSFDERGREGVRWINLAMGAVFGILFVFRAMAVIAALFLTMHHEELGSISRAYALCIAVCVPISVIIRLVGCFMVNLIVKRVLRGWILWDPWWELQTCNTRLIHLYSGDMLDKKRP